MGNVGHFDVHPTRLLGVFSGPQYQLKYPDGNEVPGILMYELTFKSNKIAQGSAVAGGRDGCRYGP